MKKHKRSHKRGHVYCHRSLVAFFDGKRLANKKLIYVCRCGKRKP